MAFEKLLLNSILLIIAAQDILTADDDFESIIPHHYTIKIEPYIKGDIFRGEYNVSITIDKDTQKITLYSENIDIYEATIFIRRRSQIIQESLQADTTFTTHVYMPIEKEYNYISKTFTFYFENILVHGNYTLNIKYCGNINTNEVGLVKTPFRDTKDTTLWILTTHSMTSRGHEVFPYLGNPIIKTTFNISVWHDKFHIALSAMPKRYSELTDNGMIWTHFHISPRMTTNEIAITIFPKSTNLTSTSIGSIVLWNRNVSLSEDIQYDNLDFFVAYIIMSFFKDRFGDLRIPQVTFVAIPGFQHDTIATLGLVLHREEDILFDGRLSATSIVQRNSIWRFLARQIALQWFLESVNSSLWLYQWFNAVAEFFGIYALDKMDENKKMINWFTVHTVHDSLHLDVNNLMEPISGQTNILSNSTHFRVPPFIKVSALLRMMENVLGQTFWKDTKSYLLGKPVLLPHNIWSCLLSDYYHILPSVPDDERCTLSWKWIQASNYPLLSMEQKSSCKYLLHALNTGLNTTEDSQYTIPTFVEFLSNIKKYKIDNGFSIAIKPQYSFSLAAKDNNDCLPIVNVRQSGYYRVNYDYEKWEHPEMFINVSSYVKLPVLVRAQIIDDEYHLFLEKKKPYSVWNNIVNYLNLETEYEAWFPMIRILEDMSGFLPFSDSEAVISFKHFIEPTLARLLLHFSNVSDEFNVKDPFQPCLRYEAFKWECLFDGLWCKILADAELNVIVKTNILEERVRQHSVFWQEWIYCDGLRDKNVTILEKVILNSKFKNHFSNAVAKYASCLEFNKVNFFNGSDLSFKKYILDDKRVLFFQSLVAKHENHLEEILRNLPYIKPGFIKTYTAICIIINHIYYPHSGDKISTYVKTLDIFITRDGLKNSVLEKLELRLSQIKKHKNKFKELWNMQK